MTFIVGLVVLFSLTGCETESFCGANPVLSFVFCRADSGSTAAPGYTPPTVPQSPQSPPSVQIRASNYVVTTGASVDFDGSWSDYDGHVTKFEWDLDGDGVYEIRGTPGAGNRDHRSRTFTAFGDHKVRLRVTDNDGLVGVDEVEVTVVRRHPTAVLVITPDSPTVGQEVTFDARGSSAPDSNIVRYRWDIDGNEANGYETLTTEPFVTRTYDAPQTITVGVRAFDDQGDRGEVRRSLTIAPAPSLLGSSARGANVPTTRVSTPALAQAAAPPAAGRLFSAHLDARPVPGRPGRLQRSGVVQSLRDMLVTGRFDGRLARVPHAPRAEALMGRLLRAGYRARLDASVNTRTRTSVTTMLALATIPGGSRSGRPALACLRITIAERPGRTPSGSFRVLGGTGDATRLAATGTFAFAPGRGTPSVLTGSVKARLIGARGLPRACAALTSPRA